MAIVKSHKRKRKNKVSVIKRHYRKVVDNFKREHGINTPIKLKVNPSSPTDSEAHTDSVMEDNAPIHHEINLERDKINENGSGEKKVLHHELGHVLAREKRVLRTKKGKAFTKLSKKTKSYRKLKHPYLKDKEEVFARAYAQKKTGQKRADVRTGENFTKKEFKKLKNLI